MKNNTQDMYPTRVSEEKILSRHDPIVFGGDWVLSAQKLEQYNEKGYVVLKNFVKGDDLSELYAFASENYDKPAFYHSAEPATGKVRSLLGFHKDSIAEKFAYSTDMKGICDQILGSDFYIHQSRINYKKGMESNGWKWHSDFETWHFQDGMPGMNCFTAMIALEENTLVNGPLMVLSGSHKEFVSCEKPNSMSSAEENFADQKEGIPSSAAIEYFLNKPGGKIEVLICDAGDMVLFDCNILHVSSANVTPYGRTNMFFVYNSVNNRLQQPYSGLAPRPIEMGDR
jgi:ectoine hydroxylase